MQGLGTGRHIALMRACLASFESLLQDPANTERATIRKGDIMQLREPGDLDRCLIRVDRIDDDGGVHGTLLVAFRPGNPIVHRMEDLVFIGRASGTGEVLRTFARPSMQVDQEIGQLRWLMANPKQLRPVQPKRPRLKPAPSPDKTQG